MQIITQLFRYLFIFHLKNTKTKQNAAAEKIDGREKLWIHVRLCEWMNVMNVQPNENNNQQKKKMLS